MHVLTNGLIRVRDEIAAWRQAREGFLANLEQGTQDRRATVSQMLAHFSKNFTEVAQRTRADRLAFLAGLKRAVTGLQREVRTDIGSVQRAFQDLRKASARAVGQIKRPGRQEAAPRARAQEDQRLSEARPAEAPGTETQGQQAKRQAAPRRHRRR